MPDQLKWATETGLCCSTCLHTCRHARDWPSNPGSRTTNNQHISACMPVHAPLHIVHNTATRTLSLCTHMRRHIGTKQPHACTNERRHAWTHASAHACVHAQTRNASSGVQGSVGNPRPTLAEHNCARPACFHVRCGCDGGRTRLGQQHSKDQVRVRTHLCMHPGSTRAHTGCMSRRRSSRLGFRALTDALLQKTGSSLTGRSREIRQRSRAQCWSMYGRLSALIAQGA